MGLPTYLLKSKGVKFTYGSGSSTSFFFRSNWSFDILLKHHKQENNEEAAIIPKTKLTEMRSENLLR